MGNNQSFEQHSDFKDLQTNYTYEKKYNDIRFGEVKLLRENSTGQKIFQKDFSSNTPKEFQDYVEEIRDCSALAHPNVLRVYGYNSKKEDLFCADFYKLSLFFESFDTDLEQEIARRARNKDYFQERELWYILDSVASGCAFLQSNKIQHRDIRPYNVFMTASKDYKISATNLFRQTYNPGYFGHFDALEAKTRYYSPELLKHFGTEESKRQPLDEFKSDVFSLGMTMLEAGLLEKTPDAYNYDKFEVREAPIRESLNKLRGRYSENFVKTIESTLDFNPNTRLDFARLDRELGHYRRDIREQARGAGAGPTSPSKPDTKATHLRMGSPERNTQHHQQDLPTHGGEHVVRSAAPGQTGPSYPGYQSDELDQRVREAVRRSEEVIKRSSPTKYANKNLDPYIQSYLRNDLPPHGQPILSQISPFLTSESKYTTTLTIEQPNYGRESQPINFNQPQASVLDQTGAGEQIKRSGYIDPGTVSPSRYGQPQTGYGQSQPTYGQPQATYGQPQSTYGQPQTGYGQPQATYGQPQSGYGQPQSGYGQTPVNTHSGTSFGQPIAAPHHGLATSTYGQDIGASGVSSHRNYGGEDDLSRRIADRLNASKQLTN